MRDGVLRKWLSTLLLFSVLAVGTPWLASAQEPGARVLIGNVDSAAFPQVSVSARVCDETGPEAGLDGSSFGVAEDGQTVLPANVKVTTITSPATRLVLAIDTSMTSAQLSLIKEAAANFVTGFLGAEDDVALVAFYDDVLLVQDFTNNTETLAAAIDALAPQGEMTAFNNAALESVRLLSEPADVRAVILITNSPDNISKSSVEDVIAAAQQAGVSVFPVGFPRARPEALKQMAAGTGGREFTADAGEVEDALHTAGQLMNQGVYRLSFLSAEMADGQEHTLTVDVDYAQASGQGQGVFFATQTPISVNMPSLADGQTVFGTIDVPVQATAAAAIESVTYALDGNTLAKVTAPPFIFAWDTTAVTPNTYTLSAQVVDRVGNTGSASASVKVVEPLRVMASVPDSKLSLGQTVAISAQVTGAGSISQVTLLVNGQPEETRQSPPFDFLLDSEGYVSGTYTVTVLAQNSLGQSGSDSRALELHAPPSPLQFLSLAAILATLGITEEQLLYILSILALVAVLVLFNLAVLGLILRSRRRKRQLIFPVEISNAGNVSSQYQLRAEEPMGALKFGFKLNGMALPQHIETTVVRRTVTVPARQVAPVAIPATARASAPAPAPTTGAAPEVGAGAKETAGKAMESGKQAVGTLGVLGRLLPGAAGQAAQRAARPIAQTQTQVSTASAKMRSQTQLAKSVTPAGVKVPSVLAQTGNDSTMVSAPGPQPAQTGFMAYVAPPEPETYVEETIVPVKNGKLLYLTPVMEPGETMAIDMTVSPLKPFRAQQYRFKVVSEAVNAPDPSPVMEEGDIVIHGLGWVTRALPYFVTVLFSGTVVVAGAALIAEIVL